MGQFIVTLTANIKEEFFCLVKPKKNLNKLMIPRVDLIIGVTFFIIFFAFYAMLALRLAESDFLFYYNYGFDLDPARFVALIAGDPSLYDELFMKGGPKHPLLYLFRPLAWPFQLVGFDVRSSASLVKALFGSGTVVVVFAFFRLVRIPRIESVGLAVLFALSSSQLFNAFIIDSYGFAIFFIAFVWCLTPLRMRAPDQFIRLRFVVTSLNIGTTVSNGVHSLISEILIWHRSRTLINSANRTLAFLVLIGVVFTLLIVMVWNDQLLKIVADPVGAVKFLYWQNPKGEKFGMEHIISSFFAHSFVSPQFTIIKLPEGVDMYDFRGFYSSTFELITFVLWALLFFVSTGLGLYQKNTRPLVIALLMIIFFNLYFHISYQYRGSLFLYAAHSHFPIFAMLMGSAYYCSQKGKAWRVGFNSYILVLTLLIGFINVDRATDFVTYFDNLNPPTPRLLLED